MMKVEGLDYFYFLLYASFYVWKLKEERNWISKVSNIDSEAL